MHPAASRLDPAPADEDDAGRLPWASLFQGFFSKDLRQAEASATVFARMIRFWLYRLGLRGSELPFDDLVQDVLLELTRCRAAIRDPRALGGWLRATTLHKVSDRWRAQQRMPLVSVDPTGPAFERPTGPGLLPDAQVLQKEDRAELLRAIGELPPLLRDCVQLYLRGLSEAEIVTEIRGLGHQVRHSTPVERHNVKNWLHKARQELRKLLTGGSGDA